MKLIEQFKKNNQDNDLINIKGKKDNEQIVTNKLNHLFESQKYNLNKK